MARGRFRSTESMFKAVQSAKKKDEDWGVFGYTKSGALCKRPSAAAMTKKEAELIASRMRGLNKRPFVVRKLR